jgi:putative ATP-dependent helicase
MVTAKKVYIAGDILQNIFSKNSMMNTDETDYVLNKVYRTDSRTILFSHVLGFGLLESVAVRWLTNSEWELSGYDINLEGEANQYRLKRKFINRFEGSKDLETINSIEVECVEEHTPDSIVSIIKNLKGIYNDLAPKDLAIIFTHYSEKSTKNFALDLGSKIIKEFNWNYVLVPRERRVQVDDEVTITNINHVKGLEFPFVIIIDNQGLNPIDDFNATIEIRRRNALYMSLTRSFVTSYLVLSDGNISGDYINKLKEVSIKLKTDGASLLVKKPDSIIEEKLLYGVDSKLIRTQEDIILDCIEEAQVDSKFKSDIFDIVLKNSEVKNGTTNKSIIMEKVKLAINIIKG